MYLLFKPESQVLLGSLPLPKAKASLGPRFHCVTVCHTHFSPYFRLHFYPDVPRAQSSLHHGVALSVLIRDPSTAMRVQALLFLDSFITFLEELYELARLLSIILLSRTLCFATLKLCYLVWSIFSYPWAFTGAVACVWTDIFIPSISSKHLCFETAWWRWARWHIDLSDCL